MKGIHTQQHKEVRVCSALLFFRVFLEIYQLKIAKIMISYSYAAGDESTFGIFKRKRNFSDGNYMQKTFMMLKIVNIYDN